ncbi:MAG: RecB family exonuclease [Acidobacteriota bacterium]
MPPTLSHSKLSTYENCPRQYRYRYIERRPRPWVGVEAHTGSAVHTALERLYRAIRAGQSPVLEDVAGWFREAWLTVPEKDLRVVKTGFDARDYFQLGQDCVERYYRRFHPFDGEEVLEIEFRVNMTLDREGKYRWIGYMDRLSRDSEETYLIHDYKTSASSPRPVDLDRDRQLSLYEIALRLQRPEVKRVQQVWDYLTLDRRFVRERRPEELQKVRDASLALARRLEADTQYPARPRILCHWCDFHPICPEGQDFVRVNPPPGLAS